MASQIQLLDSRIRPTGYKLRSYLHTPTQSADLEKKKKLDHVTANSMIGLPLRSKFKCFPRSSEFYTGLSLTLEIRVYKPAEMR